VSRSRLLAKRIVKRVLRGVINGVISYLIYYFVPTLIYGILLSQIQATYPEISALGTLDISVYLYRIDVQSLMFFIGLCCVSALVAGSWLGFIVDVCVSAYFLMYAFKIFNYGVLSAEYGGVSVVLDFSFLIIAWFISFVLDVIAKAYSYIERGAGFLPTI